MQFPCPNCDHITSSDVPPRFCSHCGYKFPTDDGNDAATVPPRTADAATVPPDSTDAPTIPPGAAAATAPARRQPEQITGFEIVRELGRGGMGVVYEAKEEQSGRNVALKLLSAGIDHSAETVKRFLQEGQIAASLSHPRSTFIYDAGEVDGRFYITMELMPGGTIKDVIDRRGKLPLTEAVNYALDLLDGLQAAHEIDVVHRDVKPSNCFVASDNRVKVGDFGISKSLVSDASLTMTGAFMGTPQFAAPEQIRSAPVDGRTDVYSAGATLFYMLAGRPPFQGDAISVVADIASETPPTLKSLDDEIPEEVSHIVARALEKDPAKRPQSASELRTALQPFSDRHSSISDIGRRMAAFFIDTMIVGVINAIVTWTVLAAVQGGIWTQATTTGATWAAVGISMLVTTLYFSICESQWGRGFGKWMMGLKVVDARGESPSFVRMLIRAILVPGTGNFVRMGVTLAVVAGAGFDPGLTSATSRNGMLMNVFTPLAGWLASLAMLSTMRARNGFRGVHELVSSTRTVRLSVAKTAGSVAPVTLPKLVDAASPEQFEVIGQLASTEQFQLFAARDVTLGRAIWLLRTGAADSPLACPKRAGVARSARQHLLRTETRNGERWDALEAVQGAPIVGVLHQQYTRIPWQTARECLIHLVAELEEAEQDGTLPGSLSLAQVWVDAAGRVKLLDLSLNPQASTVENSTRLMRSVLTECEGLLPGRGLDILQELEGRPDGLETLSWLRAELAGLGDRSGKMTWDERLGVLAISSGTEFSLTATLISITCMLSASFYESLVVPVTLAVVLPILSGWLFRGGPVFKLARVQVRRRGKLASPLRCAVRSLVAWVLGTTGLAFLWFWITSVFFAQADVLNPSAGAWHTFTSMFLLFVFGVGALVTLATPRRGIQDLIAGTELVMDSEA